MWDHRAARPVVGDVSGSAAGARLGFILPTSGRVAYITNDYPYDDTDGDSTRTFQELQYITVPPGGIALSNAGIVAGMTVTYPGACGADRLTVADGHLNATPGDIWGRITIMDGPDIWGLYEVATALDSTTVIIWDVSGQGRHMVIVVADQSAVDALLNSGREKGSDWLDTMGWLTADEWQYLDPSLTLPLSAGVIIPAGTDRYACSYTGAIADLCQLVDGAGDYLTTTAGDILTNGFC